MLRARTSLMLFCRLSGYKLADGFTSRFASLLLHFFVSFCIFFFFCLSTRVSAGPCRLAASLYSSIIAIVADLYYILYPLVRCCTENKNGAKFDRKILVILSINLNMHFWWFVSFSLWSFSLLPPNRFFLLRGYMAIRQMPPPPPSVAHCCCIWSYPNLFSIFSCVSNCVCATAWWLVYTTYWPRHTNIYVYFGRDCCASSLHTFALVAFWARTRRRQRRPAEIIMEVIKHVNEEFSLLFGVVVDVLVQNQSQTKHSVFF